MQTNRSIHRTPSPRVSQSRSSAPARHCVFHPPSSILHPPSSPVAQRPAFTIIELLTVVTIIGILMTLLVSVIGSFLTQARDSATKATIGKNQGLINSRAQAFNRLTMRKGYLAGTVEMQYVSQNSNYNLSASTQNTIAMKYLEMKYFPQQITELYNPIPAIGQQGMQVLYPNLVNTYQTIFSQAQPPGQNLSNLSQYNPALDANHTLRSSEILYSFLTQSNVLGDSPLTADAFGSAEVKDTDGNGLPEFIDAWGNPLRFYRWPTRLFRSGGAIAAAPYVATITPGDVANAKLLFSSLPVFSGNLATDLTRDPDDPLQNCLNNSPTLTSVQFEQTFHTPATYHTLLIVSAGPDGQLGLCEPDSTAINPNTGQLVVVPFGNLALPTSAAFSYPAAQDYLTDNITYLNVRAGGK